MKNNYFVLLLLLLGIGQFNSIKAQDISVDPESLNISLNYGETTTETITISNSSSGSVDFTLNGLKTKVLSLTNSVDQNFEYENTIESLDIFYDNYILTELSTQDATELEAALIDQNVLLIAQQEACILSTFDSFASVLQNYVTNGGTVIFTGTTKIDGGSSFDGSCIFATGLLTGSYSDYISSSADLTVNLPGDPLVEGVSSTYEPELLTHYYDITNADAVRLVEYNDNDVLLYRPIGTGKVILIGHSYLNTNNDLRKILANAVRSGGGVEWIIPNALAGTIDGSTYDLELTFDASQVYAGVYEVELMIITDTESVTIPITLTVIGTPSLQANPIIIDFGAWLGGSVITEQFTITNTGSDSLFITDIVSDNALFTVDITSASLSPQNAATITVTYMPINSGIDNGALSIFSNASATPSIVSLAGESLASPIPVLSTTNLEVSLTAGTTETASINLENIGEGPLSYTLFPISTPPSWLEYEPSEVVDLLPGENLDIEFNFNAEGLTAGVYTATLNFVGNGSEEAVPIVVTMFVIDFPQAQFSGTTLSCDGIAVFSDQTINVATSWTWDFGDGNTSTEQNPVHTYEAGGTYEVSLEACNDLGCDTTTGSVEVDFTAAFCDTLIMPVTGSNTVYGCAGVVMDAGGNGLYFDSSDATVTIAPPDASEVVLQFSAFNTETNFDYVEIYDGLDTNAPLIGFYEGNALPETTGTITATSGSVTILFHSDGSVTLDGFEATWQCINYNDPPIPNFSGTTLSCDGYASFFDESLGGANAWTWDFGDGNSSTEENPTHQYEEAGEYTVTLEVCNDVDCSEATGMILVDLTSAFCDTISMGLSGSQSLTACTGVLLDSGGYGNYLPNTNSSITISPPDASELILSFSSMSTGLTADYIEIYDGEDTNAPLIGNYSGEELPNNTGVITATSGAITLVMVTNGFTEQAGFEATWQCIYPTSPPISNFSGTTLSCDGYASFTDQSLGGVNAWNWDFGDGNTSTDENPTHFYEDNGTYTITLEACNDIGCETTTASILVDLAASFCDTLLMPTIGNELSTSCTGILLDPGGNADYPNGMDGTITISPTDASEIILIFTEFAMEAGFDYIEIYDGEDTNAPLLGFFEGTDLPNNGGQIIATSGSATILVHSDGSVVFSGFEATWQCINYNDPPIPNFDGTTLSCDGYASFYDQSLGGANAWTWDFGDGNTSTEENPIHFYEENGEYTVNLEVCNDVGCSELSSLVTVDLAASFCDTLSMTLTGEQLVTACTGILLDSGGDDNYLTNTNSTVSIAPPNAVQVVLTFTEFNMSQDDYIEVFDGENTTGTYLGYYEGTTLPNGDGILIAESGAVTIAMTSNNFTESAGFEMRWECVSPTQAPSPAFTNEVAVPCDGLVAFSDQSENFPSTWLWDFGDGNTSTEQNPTHAFQQNGTYAVSLETCNSLGCETLTQDVTMEDILFIDIDFNYPISVGVPHQFMDNTVGAVDWVWNFGNGAGAIGATPTVTYFEPGNYDVEVMISTDACMRTETFVVSVEPVGINDIAESAALNIYPNPTEGMLQIDYQFEGNRNLHLQVFDAVGRQVLQQKANAFNGFNKQLQLSNFAKGVYLLTITSEEGTARKQIVVH